MLNDPPDREGVMEDPFNTFILFSTNSVTEDADRGQETTGFMGNGSVTGMNWRPSLVSSNLNLKYAPT